MRNYVVIQVDDTNGVMDITPLTSTSLKECMDHAEASKKEMDKCERQYFNQCAIQEITPDRDRQTIKIVRLRTAKDLEVEVNDLELGTTLLVVMPSDEVDLYDGVKS